MGDKYNKEMKALRLLKTFEEEYAKDNEEEDSRYDEIRDDHFELSNAHDELCFINSRLYERYGKNGTTPDECFFIESLFYDVQFKKRINKLSEDGKMLCPNDLRDCKLITTGRAASWRTFALGSYIMNIFEMKEPTFVVKNFKNMLNVPEITILLLHLCFENNPDLGKSFWILVEKVLAAYEQGTPINLNDEEINCISFELTGKYYKNSHIYLYLENDEHHGIYGFYEDIDEKEKVELLKQRLIDYGNKLYIETDGKVDNSDNSSSDKLKFTKYLSPIVAATAEHREYNPFFNNKTVWSKTIQRYNLGRSLVNDENNIMESYSVLRSYVEYINEIRELYTKKDFAFNFDLYVNRILGKIRSEYNPCGKDYMLQLYTVESMLHPQLIKKLTECILGHFNDNIEEINSMDLLRRAVHMLGSMNPFVAQRAASDVCDKYFDGRDPIKFLNKLRKDEAIVEFAFIKYGDAKKEERIDDRKVLERFIPVLLNQYDNLGIFNKEIRQNFYNEAFHSDLSIINYKKFTQKYLEDNNENYEKIKIWVTKALFFYDFSEVIEFQDE